MVSDDPDDLDGLVRRVDPDRWLSSRFVADAAERADVVALYALDHELARAPRVASNPLLGEIRLAWWREVLDEIFEGREVRRHPGAQALARATLRRSLPRAPLEAMIDARHRELDPAPLSEAEALAWAADTGGRAAELAAGLLDPAGEASLARGAGAAWALARRAFAQPDLAAGFRRSLRQARSDSRQLSARAFPAVAHAALAAARARGAEPAGLGARLRIIGAVAAGRI
jgi:phytoene synthase